MVEGLKGNDKNFSKVYIKTFGCQMNDRDSEALAGLFLERGYSLAEKSDDADVILVNTCSVRQHAEDRATSLLGTFKRLKEKRDIIVGVIGCMAKKEGENLIKKMPYLDIVCGPARLYHLPVYIEKVRSTGLKIVDTDDQEREEAFYESSFLLNPYHAQVVISVGCSNYCSYCIVPFVRGELKVRKPKDIIREVEQFIQRGVSRITLLGQNVNDYHYSDIDFIQLLTMVAEINGVKELDFITSHPKNTSIKLFETMARFDNIRKHLHLPLQSGSTRVLELMERGYTREEYLRLADNFYKIVGGTLSTDIIVGFPSETEEDFLLTKELMERVKFRFAYIFKYSPRYRTKASEWDDDVPQEIKEKRHRILLELQKSLSQEFKNKTVGL